jgi:hypothetical protein
MNVIVIEIASDAICKKHECGNLWQINALPELPAPRKYIGVRPLNFSWPAVSHILNLHAPCPCSDITSFCVNEAPMVGWLCSSNLPAWNRSTRLVLPTLDGFGWGSTSTYEKEQHAKPACCAEICIWTNGHKRSQPKSRLQTRARAVRPRGLP